MHIVIFYVHPYFYGEMCCNNSDPVTVTLLLSPSSCTEKKEVLPHVKRSCVKTCVHVVWLMTIHHGVCICACKVYHHQLSLCVLV